MHLTDEDRRRSRKGVKITVCMMKYEYIPISYSYSMWGLQACATYEKQMQKLARRHDVQKPSPLIFRCLVVQ